VRSLINGAGPELESTPGEYIEPPALVAHVKDAFGICVTSNENYPAYSAGDRAFVHPRLPPVPGSDVLIRPRESKDKRVYLGQLKDETESDWVIAFYNERGTLKLAKSEWACAGCIVARYNRR
jgi:hypothetical protein